MIAQSKKEEPIDTLQVQQYRDAYQVANQKINSSCLQDFLVRLNNSHHQIG
jgi:archaellum biogenesis protein FlaJ (TadC family)